MPGLIPGASEGKGLGLEFLRHVERCAALVHVIDCATLEPGRDPLSDLEVIEAELAAYPVDPDSTGSAVPLTERPRIVALNKVDIPEGRELAELVRPELEARGYQVVEVSATARDGLRALSFAMAALVKAARDAAPAQEATRVVIRPVAVDDAGFTVTREQDPHDMDAVLFRVEGVKPERWVRQTDFANDEAVGYLADRLARLGVEEKLYEAGAIAGSTVVIGTRRDSVVFDWEPTMVGGAELLAGPRGSDLRLAEPGRKSRGERREEHAQRRSLMDEARAELEADRRAGRWTDPDED